MKRKIFIAAAMLLGALSLSAQHYSHWSVLGYGGASFERGGMRDFDANQSYSLRGEYALSPMMSLGLEGNYIAFNQKKDYTATDIWSTYFYGSLNLSNAFLGTGKKLGILFNVGIGPSWGGTWGFKKTENNITISGFAGVGLDWNVSKHWALGLEGRIRPFASERYRGTHVNKATGKQIVYNNENSMPAFYEAGLYIRYKLASWKRDADHMRNTDMTKLRRF